jgi:hypothetical protein
VKICEQVVLMPKSHQCDEDVSCCSICKAENKDTPLSMIQHTFSRLHTLKVLVVCLKGKFKVLLRHN